MKSKRRILFVKLGHFSYTNDRVAEQIVRNFPDHDLTVVDVKDYVKRDQVGSAFNLLIEVATYGPSVLRNRSDLHAYFFRTPFMFRRLNEALLRNVSAIVPELDFVIQTQGIFNGRMPGTPMLIYTDYTYLDFLEVPDYDRRIFQSKKHVQDEASLYKTAEAVATTGSHVQRTLIEQYGCDPSRVTTVHVGANIEVKPASSGMDRYNAKHVLFVGVQWERKGGPALVEGFLRTAKNYPEARLTIVGCSPAVSDPRITVVGLIPREEIPHYYEAASIFCMPSLIEPLGIAAVEASLFYLPVVATRLGGFYETVTDNETGVLVPPDDPAAIAMALERLFEAPDLARRMGLAGFERNHIRFDWNEVGKRLRSIAETIAPGLNTAT